MSEDCLVKLSTILKSIVSRSASRTIKISELIRLYEEQERGRLKEVAQSSGFSNVSDLVKSFTEFRVIGSGFQTVVKLIETDSTKEEINRSSPVCQNENAMDSNDREKSTEPSQPKLVKTINKIIPSPIPLEKHPDYNKTTLQVYVLDLQSPHRFWFVERSELKKLKQLMCKMKEFYENNDDLVIPEQNDLMKGLYVAALYTGQWHRAFILNTWPQGFVRVFYIDFGTVSDVPFWETRYLTEDFLAFPATAHRGVLSHVQPVQESWSEESIEFMKQTLDKKFWYTKIFKKNEKDSSYLMALRSSAGQLLTDMMIKKDFCIFDSQFTNTCSGNMMDFIDYENGKHLKDPDLDTSDDSWLPKATKPQASLEDSWLPTAKPPTTIKNNSNFNNASSKRSSSSETKSSEYIQSKVIQLVPFERRIKPVKEYRPPKPNVLVRSSRTSSQSSPGIVKQQPSELTRASLLISGTSSQSSPGMVKEQPVEPTKVSSQSSPGALKEQPVEQTRVSLPLERPPVSKPLQIKPKNFDRFVVGEFHKIYIHSINSVEEFYFYLKDEMLDTHLFLKDMNQAYDEWATPNDNFAIGSDVVTWVDENFCRGRIVGKGKQMETFDIFLLDFGRKVDMPREKIFKLHDQWMEHQAGVYLGQLANTPEHAYIKSVKQFKEIVDSRMIQVKISRITKKSLELLLMDF